MRKWLTVLLLVVTPTLKAADTDGVQVPVPMKDRVPNGTGIQCVWSSISLCGRYQGISEAATLWHTYKSYGSPWPTAQILADRGINFEWCDAGYKNVDFLKKHLEAGRPIAVTWSSRHMLTLVHLKDGYAKIIDNSDPSLSIKTYYEHDFMRMWDGWAIALLPTHKLMPLPQEKK